MGTYSKCITATGSGGTAGTYSSVGTITLNSDAQRIRALIAIACTDKLTTVEGNAHCLRLTGIPKVGTEYFAFGNTYGNGVATNEESFGVSAEYIPMNIPVEGSEVITVEYSFVGVTCTENQDIAVAIVWQGPGGIPNLYDMAISLGAKGPSNGGVLEDVDNATIAEVAFSTAGTTIPSWASAITNILVYPVLDGVPVVDDPVISKYRFESSAPNFSPQEYPGCTGSSGGLGTSIVGKQGLSVFPYPVYIPLGPGSKNLTCYSNLTVANAGNVGHVYNARYI